MKSFTLRGPPAGPFLSRQKAIGYVGVPPTTFQRLIESGVLPAPICISERVRLFSQPALDEAIAQRAVSTGGRRDG